MNRISLIIWLIIIFFLQVFVLNNINFSGYVNPYLYISIIFLFPLNKNRFLFLTIAFLYGLGVDFFSDTGGIHAFSLLFVAYLRLLFVKIFFKKTELDYLLFRLHSEPFGQVFNYVVTLTIIHHFILISLANFSFQNLGGVLLNTLYSSIFTLILYFLGSYIFRRKQVD
ncbi:rod shape-determining protein MreD [Pseudotenacibaculum haliotis]|uniref:Rod shape-determining protein MreD n=1 Tax=Pseudotenacibaculum haliotis TaxID=1862138 RepID=A0ABW5LRD2_9FLAO